MVYRQTIKGEMAKVDCGISADNDDQLVNRFDKSVASFKVGSKKLVIPSSSSTTSTASGASAETKPKLLLLDHVGKDGKKCDRGVGSDDNNNDDCVKTANTAIAASVASAEMKPKLLLLDPVGKDRKKCDRGVGGDNNNNDDCVKTANTAVAAMSVDVSKIASSVDDLKLDSSGAAVSNGCCISNKIVDADSKNVEIDAAMHADDTAQQTVTQKGRRVAKKPTAGGGKKGNFLTILIDVDLCSINDALFLIYSWVLLDESTNG